MLLRRMLNFLGLMTFLGTPALAQCPNYGEVDHWDPVAWVTGVVGGNPNGTNQDCVIQSLSGQFPNAVMARIKFSKEPSAGNGCKFHSGGSTTAVPWNRWADLHLAELQLPEFVDFGIRVDYDLATFDQWIPGSPESSDVFYLMVGEESPAGGALPISLGTVSCADSPRFDDDPVGYEGLIYWWGNNDLACSGTCNQNTLLEPCSMSGTRIFDYLAGTSVVSPHLRIGLSTGWCIWSYGTFDVKILPLSIDIVDPVSDDESIVLVENGYVANAPELFALSSNLREGVAADGATQVVLRHEVLGPGQVEFRVEDFSHSGPHTTDPIGFLSSLGGQEQTTTLTAEVVELSDGRYMAFAVYHAPADFVTTPLDIHAPCRQVRITARYQAEANSDVEGHTIVSRLVKIVRPPVVLQHGLWSDPSTWGGPPQTFLTDEKFSVWVSDYSQSNDRNYMVNRKVTKNAIAEATKKLRIDQNCAVTRADVVGHSMGGVLARLYAQSFGGITYRRNDNFNSGDIHKLITVDSPLKGSELASFLMINPDFQKMFAFIGNNCTHGAVSDLNPFRYPLTGNHNVQANLQTTDVYVHAIVATGGATVCANPTATSWFGQTMTARIMKHVELCNVFNDAHDLIVAEQSQIGNIVNVSTFPFLDADNPGLHGTVLQEERVRDEVRNLLNTNILDNAVFAPTIPARTLGGTPLVPQDHPKVDGMSMVAPTSGAVFASGGQIVVTVAPINGFQPESILVLSPFDVQNVDPLLLQTTLTVPAEAIGPMPIYVSAFDANSNLAETDDVVIQIVPAANLTGISIAPTSFELTGLGPTQALTVIGHYDDAIDRNLTSSVLGTTYQVANPSVATVSADGLVTSVDVGQTTVTATNGSFTADAQADVVGLPILGDFNADGVLDQIDRGVFCVWMLGASQGDSFYDPAADFNSDGVIDHLDQEFFNQILPPCTGDIVTSATLQPPPDGTVDGADLAFLLDAWGNGSSCADFVTSATFAPPPDGVVDGADLAVLLDAWGPCGAMLKGGGASMMSMTANANNTSGNPYYGTYLGLLLEELIATNDADLAELAANELQELMGSE